MAESTKNMTVGAGSASASVTATVTDRMPGVPCPTTPGYTYTGMRYVPVFADPAEWSSANSYEPLEIVIHEGNSYTSKTFVPVGVDISNPQYWALTGNYNAQVEQYRQEVQQFDGRITKLESDNSKECHYLQSTTAQLINAELAENVDKVVRFSNNFVYELTDVINVPAGSRIDLNGATVKRTGNVHNVVNVTGNDVVMVNGTIDGNKAEGNLVAENPSDRFDGIRIANVSDVMLENITIKNCVNAEIQAEGTHGAVCVVSSKNIYLRWCDFDGNDRTGLLYLSSENIEVCGGHGLNNNGSAISGSSSTNVRVSDFMAIGNGYTGISMNGDYLTVINCVSNGNSYSGLDFGHTADTPNKFICIGCTCKGNTLDGITTQYSERGIIDGCIIEANTRSQINNYVGRKDDILIVSNTQVVNADTRSYFRCDSKITNCAFSGISPFIYTTGEGKAKINGCTFKAVSGSYGCIAGGASTVSVNDSVFDGANLTDTQVIGGSGNKSATAVKLTGFTLPSALSLTEASSGNGAKFAYVAGKYFMIKLPFNIVFVQVIGASTTWTETIPEGFRPVRNTEAQFSSGAISVDGDKLSSSITTNSASMVYYTADIPL